ncbi:MAG TPA: GntR family transcriptional regulator [Planctomycetota bacterium]|nr:GntR family transcriptional regulator [Planctomycetota bacterium]
MARLSISIDPKAEQSPSEQLVLQVCFAIASGVIGEGERLPSVRTLAVDASVNPNTVGKAWRDLERMGVLDSRPGDGVFVAAGATARASGVRDARLSTVLARWIDDAQTSGLTRRDIERCFETALAKRRGWKSLGESA